MKHLWTLPLAALLALSGCPSANDDDSAVDDDDTSVDDDDTSDDDDTVDDDDDTVGDDDDSAPQGFGTITGTLTRAVEPTGDAMGSLVVLVLPSAPNRGGQPPKPVVAAPQGEVDLSGNDASFTYTITDVPVRPEPYVLSAHLDDDGSGGPPNTGDLIATGADSGPIEAVVNTPGGSTTVDFALDMVAP